MSFLSDEVTNQIGAGNSEELTQVLNKLRLSDTPGYSEFGSASHSAFKSVMRGGRFYFGGSKWESALDAIHRTSEYLQPHVVPKLVEMMSMGIEVGRDPELVRCKNFTELFKSDSFKMKTSVRSLEFTFDPEARSVIVNFVAGVLACTTTAMGYRDLPQSELNHIWDVWYHTLGNSCHVMYVAGFRIGQKRWEMEILDGIQMATMSKGGET